MFNLEIITRILNFVWLSYNIKKELLIQKKEKKRKERKRESTCSIKFYVVEAIYHNTLMRKKTELELQIDFMKLFRRDQKFDVTSHFITSKSKFLNVENFMRRGTITYIH